MIQGSKCIIMPNFRRKYNAEKNYRRSVGPYRYSGGWLLQRTDGRSCDHRAPGQYGDPRCGDHAYRSAHGGAHAGALHLPLYR